MTLLKTSAEISDFCAPLADAPYVTVDTEFMREKTYYPILCLIQIAAPGHAAVIDPLIENIDLDPVFELMRNLDVIKVFHAARQDIEIFYHLMGEIPAPLFDTQIAAMACGHGDQIGYEPLVRLVTGQGVDKGSRFTDWSIRPLAPKQLDYALGDVTYLRDVYEALTSELAQRGREDWIADEMAQLQSADLYHVVPQEAWRRLKIRHIRPRDLGGLIKLAEWRELEAQRRDIPRGRVLKDEALLELSRAAPGSVTELARCRSIARGVERSAIAAPLLEAIREGRALAPEDLPQSDPVKEKKTVSPDVLDLLRVLLKKQCEAHDIAPKLIASMADLEEIACDDEAHVPALMGWRRDIFGQYAIDLKKGRLGLSLKQGVLELVEMRED